MAEFDPYSFDPESDPEPAAEEQPVHPDDLRYRLEQDVSQRCSCGNCGTMLTEVEHLCCKEIQKVFYPCMAATSTARNEMKAIDVYRSTALVRKWDCYRQGLPISRCDILTPQDKSGKGVPSIQGASKTPTSTPSAMDSVRSLGAPLKQFTSCVYRTDPGSKKTPSVRRNSFTRRKSIGARRMSLPCTGIGRRRSLPYHHPSTNQKVPDSWLRVYQAELKKERKRRQAVMAKKNAERSIRKTHFRSQHCLSRKPTKPARKSASKAHHKSFFGAFQGLSLDGARGTGQGATASADQCKVM